MKDLTRRHLAKMFATGVVVLPPTLRLAVKLNASDWLSSNDRPERSQGSLRVRLYCAPSGRIKDLAVGRLSGGVR